MKDTSLIAISKNFSTPGYVYLIRFNYCKNCYKIGSTGNLYSRLKSFGDAYVDVDLIAYGYASNKLLVERELQRLFHEFSNNRMAFKCNRQWVINYQFAGSITSSEHFIFDTMDVCNVIVAFDMLCNSVQIGTNNPLYAVNPNCIPIGYGEELRKFYDPGQRRYVPYPTQFKNGYPVFIPVEEWGDDITQPIKMKQGWRQ